MSRKEEHDHGHERVDCSHPRSQGSSSGSSSGCGSSCSSGGGGGWILLAEHMESSRTPLVVHITFPAHLGQVDVDDFSGVLTGDLVVSIGQGRVTVVSSLAVLADPQLAVTLAVPNGAAHGVSTGTLCVEFARTDRGGDVGAVPVTSVPGVSDQLPALVTLNHTPVVGGVLLVDVVPAEEARGTVLVDE